MNAWLLGACVLVPLGVGPCVWRACRGDGPQRLIALAMAGTLIAAVVLLISQAVNRSSYVDVALTLVVLAPAGTLVFARFVGGDDPQSLPRSGKAARSGKGWPRAPGTGA